MFIARKKKIESNFIKFKFYIFLEAKKTRNHMKSYTPSQLLNPSFLDSSLKRWTSKEFVNKTAIWNSVFIALILISAF